MCKEGGIQMASDFSTAMWKPGSRPQGLSHAGGMTVAPKGYIQTRS